MKFVDSYVDRINRFSVGQEQNSGCFYLSIPVANRLVDYEEYYEISKALHDSHSTDSAALKELAERCRLRQYDNHLIVKPDSDRGVGI